MFEGPMPSLPTDSTSWLVWMSMVLGAIVGIGSSIRTVRLWFIATFWTPLRRRIVTRDELAQHIDLRLGEVLNKLQELIDQAREAQESRACATS
jgi:hypothetical protein